MAGAKVICDIPGCGKELAESSLRAHKKKHQRDDARDELRDAATNPAGAGAENPPSPTPGAGGPYAGDETTPGADAKKRGGLGGIKERLWGPGDPAAGDADKRADRATPVSNERRPVGKRQPADAVLGMAYGGAGLALERSGADVPVGRLMQLMAPAAGEILDRAAAGTAVDRLVLQRLAGSDFQNAEDLAMVLGAPILVGLVWRQPELAVPLETPIKFLLRRMLVSIAAAEKKRRAEEAKYRDAVAELLPEGAETPDGFDPVEMIWAQLFADVEPPPAPEPASANGAAAGATVPTA